MYATVVPKPGVKQPQMGWGFMYDSEKYEAKEGNVFPPDVAEHARAYFTPNVQAGESECLVDIEYHEGAVEMRPKAAPQVFTCPVCQKFETQDYKTVADHIRECSLAEASASRPAAPVKPEK
jgi:hypothetical protein